MSQEQQQQLTNALTKLGLSTNQAKIYSALASLGPAGVAEIQKTSGVPRTKIYEVLEQLLSMGAVEFQSGRPTIYNALSPNVLVERMRNSYLSAADEATKLLAEMSQADKESDDDLVWTVRGSVAVNQKAVSTIASAKVNLLMFEQYPPNLIANHASVLRALIQRGVSVKVYCMVMEGQRMDETRRVDDFVEFRRISTKRLAQGVDGPYGGFWRPLVSIISRASCLIIVDDAQGFIAFPDKAEPPKRFGLWIKVPGLPMLQRIFFEKFALTATTKIR